MDQLVKLPEGTQLTVGAHKVKILQYLSEGGFAHIYKVHIDPKEDNSDIACLKRVIIPDKTGLDQLRKEVEVMKRLRHCRCVVKYFDSHAERLESGSYQVLVLMELCPNKSLLDLMNAKIKTKLSEKEILQIMIDISIAVYEMHRLKMVHRDIKIENVLLDVNFRYKLGDFGSTSPPIKPPLSQHEFQALSHDLTYQTTPQYRSPEMIDLYRGFPIDEKSDIWALGCFLYKLCYYTTPFEANGDIAILHASYQFPPAPVYSGDLKNLIIIMLQESPVLRPNIVQVIKLVASLLHLDFKSLGVEDIYKAGSYNFQALHEYQRQKQAEILKQQQMYYQQQQVQLMQPDTTSQAADAQVSDAQVSDAKDELVEPEVDSSDLNDVEDLDNIEERYPSLENIIADSGTPKSGTTSVKSGGTTEATSAHFPSTKSQKSDTESRDERQKLPYTLPSVPYTLPYQAQGGSVPGMPYPQQPVVLLPQELQKLSADQLQQYNYQHQMYHYQINQWIYMQQQQQQQQPQQQRSYKSFEKPVDKLDKVQSMERSVSNYTELQNKEAWEKLQSTMNEDAGKLADDIFGSKSRSPSEFTEPQKTSQSVKSEPAHQAVEDDEEDEPPARISKSNNSSEINLPNKGAAEDTDVKDQEIAPSELELLDGEKEQAKHVEEPEQQVDRLETHERPDYDSSQSFASSPVVPTTTSFKTNNPFPVKPEQYAQEPYNQPEPYTQPEPYHQPEPYAQPEPYTQPETDDYTDPEPAKTSEPKSSNPWGDYTTTQPLPKPRLVSARNLHHKMNSLSLSESASSSRHPSNEEAPNLIDLDVIESREVTNAPPVVLNESIRDSLIDLEEPEEMKKHPDKPHFKKRVSAIPNPSDFKVEEEIIDWASDDESPENSSKMSRISIRNSLKLSRKSGEHKRSESSSSDHRKRLSRLILNN